MASFDACIGHQSNGDSRVLNVIAKRARHRRNVFERLAHKADVRIGIGRCLRQNIRKMACIAGFQSERSQRIRNDIRHISQILAGSCRKIHNRRKTIKHVVRFPACHRHIFERLSCLSGRELRRRTHFERFRVQLFHFCRRCAGNGFDAGHLRGEIHAGAQNAFAYSLERICNHGRKRRSCPNHVRADAFQLCLNGANRPRHAGRIQIKAGKQFADL